MKNKFIKNSSKTQVAKQKKKTMNSTIYALIRSKNSLGLVSELRKMQFKNARVNEPRGISDIGLTDDELYDVVNVIYVCGSNKGCKIQMMANDIMEYLLRDDA